MEKIEKIQRRFFRNEKNQFLDTVEEKLIEYGYEFERKLFGSIIKSVNLETKCDKPDFIFIAHYDTGTIMPFWIVWLTKFFGYNNQFLIIIFIILVSNLVPNLLSNLVFSNIPYPYFSLFPKFYNILGIIILISFLSIFIPNKKNFDDNTSGVIALLKLAKKFKENGINNIKFIFADNEEIGLFGSNAHRKYLEKNQLISRHCKVISIDCVGGKGEIPLIVQNYKSDYAKIFQKEIQNDFELCKSIKTIIPFSDNYSFKEYGALNISFVNKSVIPSGYYISKIHSPKDNYIDLNKIEKLTDTLVNIITKKNYLYKKQIIT